MSYVIATRIHNALQDSYHVGTFTGAKLIWPEAMHKHIFTFQRQTDLAYLDNAELWDFREEYFDSFRTLMCLLSHMTDEEIEELIPELFSRD